MSASNNLPFLVGHRFIDPYKTDFHKKQAWVVSQQTCVGKIIFIYQYVFYRKAIESWPY